jgi:hypothetical protein
MKAGIDNLFYLQDSRGLTGNNVMFHNIDGAGYGTNLDRLHVYTLEEAQQSHDGRNTDVPLLKSLVDEFSILAVDMQVQPTELTTDVHNKYVVQVTGCWNGNDICFLAMNGNSYNYLDAKLFNREDGIKLGCKEGFALFAKSDMDRVCRRTFQAININRLNMIKRAGIKLATPKRKRPTTGKTRGNCPKCGKITWDFNPYENAHCDWVCEAG